MSCSSISQTAKNDCRVCIVFYLFLHINAHYIIVLSFYILLCFCIQSMHDEDNIKGINSKIETKEKLIPSVYVTGQN